MKGYSLKVTVKGRKPPVWWRCYTAAGITFSALSMILDALTEQPGKNDFCFVISRMASIILTLNLIMVPHLSALNCIT